MPTTVQFSIVHHAQNSSRDLQATGSSNLREFHGNQIAKTTCEQLSSSVCFCFSSLWFKVFWLQNFLRSSFLGKYLRANHCSTKSFFSSFSTKRKLIDDSFELSGSHLCLKTVHLALYCEATQQKSPEYPFSFPGKNNFRLINYRSLLCPIRSASSSLIGIPTALK